MRRPIRQDSGAAGQDSFLDVLANIVGILIILVMVVGVRVRNAPVELEGPDDATRTELAGLVQDQDVVASMRSDVLKLAAKIEDVQGETAQRNQERLRMATLVAAAKHDIDLSRSQLDAQARQDFDLRRSLAESRARLDQLQRQRESAEKSTAAPTVVKCYPTPLSRPVDDNEAHFQLRGGLIVFVPMRELLEEFTADARAKADNLRRLPELTETVGPIGGFRLRYTLQRKEMALEVGRRGGVVGTFASLDHLSLIPVSGRMGETVDAALAEGSEFRRALGRYRPGRSTVTIWTYPDSFEEFRRLKKELYQMGYETAGRPLPFGVPISASPEGSKSAAE